MNQLADTHLVQPVELTWGDIRLVPMQASHEQGLREAATDGQLWKLRVTSVPEPENTGRYIQAALQSRHSGDRFPFVVTLADTGQVIGSTSYHDILPAVKRVEIGWTWYAKRFQGTHVNAACKLLMMSHAFETLGCSVIGWRTDNFNFASQRAIERLGAKLDGVLRGHALRRDGTVRDTYFYSMRAGEWPEAKAELLYRLAAKTAL